MMSHQSNPCKLLALLADAQPNEIPFKQILQQTGMTGRQLSNAASTLKRLGFIKSHQPRRYFITAAGILAVQSAVNLNPGPRGANKTPRLWRNTLRQRVWRALRMSQKASIPELLISAATGGESDPGNNVRRYIKALARAGYLVELNRRELGNFETSNGWKKWLLINDTGPRAPLYRRERNEIYDPNTNETISLDKEICNG